MADWVVCPGCRLKHARRADGACPRCHVQVDVAATAAVPAAPEAKLPDVFDEAAFANVTARRQAEKSSDEERLTLAERVAGAILLGNGVLLLSLRALEPSADWTFALVNPWAATFDLIVGAVLLTGQGQVRRWTIVRLWAGLAVFSLLHVLRGHSFDLLMQLVFAGGLLALLVRRATPTVLRVVGAGGAVWTTLMAGLVMAPHLGLANPLGQVIEALNGEVAWSAAGEISGQKVGYQLVLADDRWHLATARGNAEAEEETEPGRRQESSPLLRRPDVLAEMQLFALQAPPDVTLDQAQVIEALVEHQRDELSELLVVGDSWIDTAGGTMRVLEGNAEMGGQRVGVALGFAVEGQCVFMLAATAPQRMFPTVRDDVLQSFAALQAPGCAREGASGLALDDQARDVRE